MQLAKRIEDENLRYHFRGKLPDYIQDKIDNKNLTAENSSLESLMAATQAYEVERRRKPKETPPSVKSNKPNSKPANKSSNECSYCASIGFPETGHHGNALVCRLQTRHPTQPHRNT
jgi:hypothetical protein